MLVAASAPRPADDDAASAALGALGELANDAVPTATFDAAGAATKAAVPAGAVGFEDRGIVGEDGDAGRSGNSRRAPPNMPMTAAPKAQVPVIMKAIKPSTGTI